jgi:outer membrane murein-binding lipoprotein Lpp
MDKTLIAGIILAVLLLAGAFFAGRETVHCPQVDQSTIDLLSARVVEKDSAIAQLQRESAKTMARADSLAAIREDYDVEKILPRVPLGRDRAEVDRIMSELTKPF